MEFDTLTLLAMVPGMHHGHMISLLRNIAGSGFCDHGIPKLWQMNQDLINQARTHFGPLDTFSSGPLSGTPISAQHVEVQARYLAAQLIIADEGSQELLAQVDHPILERIFNPFIIDSFVRSEIMEAVDIVGNNEITARAFIDIYHGLPAVLILE